MGAPAIPGSKETSGEQSRGGAGCVSVPSLDGIGLPVTELVRRIKCELLESVPEPVGKYQRFATVDVGAVQRTFSYGSTCLNFELRSLIVPVPTQ
jgi:hypothetical protein